MTEKISVIVPVFNCSEYLSPCLDSIIKQTYKNLEIILVDDGSNDKSGEICDEYAEKDSRIRVIHKENGGVSSARNAGLDIASGDYIAFVDGDDILEEDFYEFLLKNLIEFNADISRCGIVRITGDIREPWSIYKEPTVRNNTEGICDVGEANGILPVSPCNKIYKRSIVENLRFDTSFKYAEDTLYNYYAAKNARRTVCFDLTKYHYISNPDSASHRNFSEDRFSEHIVCDIIMNEEKNNPKTYPYCQKGDIMKAFRTIKEMTLSGNDFGKFGEIRKRIVKNRKIILKSGLYSRTAKLKTLLLWLAPNVYRLYVKKTRG